MAFTFITTLSLLLSIAGAVEDWSKTHPNDESVTPAKLLECLKKSPDYKAQVEKMPKDEQDALTCDSLFGDQEAAEACQSDASSCCPDNCFREIVCGKDYPRNAGSTPTDSPYTELTYHYEYKYANYDRPFYCLGWSFLCSEQRVKYNSCKKLKVDYKETNPWLKILCAGDDKTEGAKIKASYKCDGADDGADEQCKTNEDCNNTGDPDQTVTKVCKGGICVLAFCATDEDCVKEGESGLKCIQKTCTVPNACYRPKPLGPGGVYNPYRSTKDPLPATLPFGVTQKEGFPCYRGYGLVFVCDRKEPGPYTIKHDGCIGQKGEVFVPENAPVVEYWAVGGVSVTLSQAIDYCDKKDPAGAWEIPYIPGSDDEQKVAEKVKAANPKITSGWLGAKKNPTDDGWHWIADKEALTTYQSNLLGKIKFTEAQGISFGIKGGKDGKGGKDTNNNNDANGTTGDMMWKIEDISTKLDGVICQKTSGAVKSSVLSVLTLLLIVA